MAGQALMPSYMRLSYVVIATWGMAWTNRSAFGHTDFDCVTSTEDTLKLNWPLLSMERSVAQHQQDLTTILANLTLNRR